VIDVSNIIVSTNKLRGSYKLKKLAAAACVSITLTACNAYPKKIAYYDQECDIIAEKLVVEANEDDLEVDIKNCSDETCILREFNKVTRRASEVVIASTIVVAGNTIYWFEKQGKCRKNAG
jgi:hypothetical protein